MRVAGCRLRHNARLEGEGLFPENSDNAAHIQAFVEQKAAVLCEQYELLQ